MDEAWDRDDGAPEPMAWPEDAEIPLCPACIRETVPAATWCHHCMAPLGWFANTGPLERVWSWPWVVARSHTIRCPRLLHPLGVTLIFAPELLGLAALLLVGGTAAPRLVGGDALAVGILAPLWLLLVLGYVVRAWRHWSRHRADDPWAGHEDGGPPEEPAANV